MEKFEIKEKINIPGITRDQILEGDLTNVPPSIARAILEYRLTRPVDLFDSLMAVNIVLNEAGKVPRPRAITSIRRAINQITDPIITSDSVSNLATDLGITVESAALLTKSSDTISEELQKRGLLYRGQPFNFALTTPYPFPKTLAERMAVLSTEALQAVDKLAQEDNRVDYLLNRGSTLWDRRLWRDRQSQFQLSAPLNRIDVIDGKIIEFGPTYTDGFATAQIFAEVWGIGSLSVQTLSETFIDLYRQSCLSRDQETKDQPSIALTYTSETTEMKEELAVVGQRLMGSDRFRKVLLGRPYQMKDQVPNILYYYFKPSMLEAYMGNPLPDGEALMEMVDKGTCIVPPLREQLGKKVVLTIIATYPQFFSEKLGNSNYQELLSIINPTQIVTSDFVLPSGDWVLKPSSGGSCDGVISSSDPNFPEVLQQAKESYDDTETDLWVIQPKIAEMAKSMIVKPTKKPLKRVVDLSLKQTLMVANKRPAGAFATASSKWIIDDGGFGYPCKFTGGTDEK